MVAVKSAPSLMKWKCVFPDVAGEWMLQDMETGLGVINRFNLDEVETCVIEWGSSLVTLELWTQERGVSKETPLVIAHEYELIDHPVHHD